MSTRSNSTSNDPVIESRDDLLAPMIGGEKPKDRWRIGTEHEKFVFSRDTHAAPSYAEEGGIRDLLLSLEQFGWSPVEELGPDGKMNVIAMSGEDGTVSLSDLQALDALADQYESEGLQGRDAKLWLAMSLAANDYPADANDIFREALEAPGASPRARLEWARLFRARYNHRDASQLLEEALKADPDHPEILVELAAVDVEVVPDPTTNSD